MKLSHWMGLLAARLVAWTIPKRVMCSPRFFSVWEASGYHIVPIFYESPVPYAPELAESLWQQPSEMITIDMHDAAQLGLLESFQGAFKAEYDAFPTIVLMTDNDSI